MGDGIGIKAKRVEQLLSGICFLQDQASGRGGKDRMRKLIILSKRQY